MEKIVLGDLYVEIPEVGPEPKARRDCSPTYLSRGHFCIEISSKHTLPSFHPYQCLGLTTKYKHANLSQYHRD